MTIHIELFPDNKCTSLGPLKQQMSLAGMDQELEIKGTNNGCSEVAQLSQQAKLPKTNSSHSHTHGQWRCSVRGEGGERADEEEEENSLTGCS